MIGLSEEACVGRPALLLDERICSGIVDGIVPALRGQPCSFTVMRQVRSTRAIYYVRGIPVQLNVGRTGVAVIIGQAPAQAGDDARLQCYEKLIDRFMAVLDPVILQFSESFEISFANEGFVRTFLPDESSSSTSLLPFHLIVHDQERLSTALEEARKSGECRTFLHLIHPSGDIKIYHWTIHADQQAGVWQYLAIGKDHTDQYFQREQLNHFLESTEMIFGKRTQDLREINRRLYHEISERRQNEETLRMYEYTIHHVGDLVFWFTSKGRILYSNNAARLALSIPEKTEQAWIHSFFPHPPLGDWGRLFTSLAEQGSIVLETCMHGTDRKILPVEIRFTLIPYGGQEYCCCIARDISARNLALDRLVEDESRFRELAETISDVVYVRDLTDGRIEYLNQAYEEIYQKPVSTLYEDPDSWISSIHPEDYERVVAQAGVPLDDRKMMEYRIIRPSGEIRWVRVKIHYVRGPEAKPIREIGIISDITDEKRVHDEVRQLHERFSLAVHAAPVTIFGQDRDLVYQWVVNPSINLNQADIIGLSDDAIFPPETARRLYAIKRAVIKTGEGFSGECLIQFGGKSYPFHLYIRPFRNDQGEIEGLIGAAIDIQDILHQKRTLAISEQRSRTLFDAMQEGIMVFSPLYGSDGRMYDFSLVDLNQYAVQRINRPKRELIGKSLSEFRPDIDHRLWDTLFTVAQTENEAGFDSWSELFGGYVSVRIFPVGEKMIGVVIRDITDQMRQSEHLQAHRDLARELAATTDLGHALNLILQTALEVPGIDSGGLYILSKQEMPHVLILHCHRGLSEEYIEAVRTMPVTEHVLALFDKGEPRYVKQSDSAADRIRPLIEKEGILSYVLIPLYEDGNLVGCLNLASHTLTEIPYRERPFLEALSGWLGRTLARFITELERDSHIGYAVVHSDGSIIEGTLWSSRLTAPPDIFDCIKQNYASLLIGNEITLPHSSDHHQYLIRFCPWDGEVAFLIRSGGSRL